MEANRQTYSPFRESSSVALQTSTDLEGLKVVIIVRRLAAQEHSVALAQRASRISAVMKFSIGADDDPFVKVKVQSASASRKETSGLNLTMRVDRIVASVLTSSPIAARLFYHDAVNSVWAAQVDRSGQEHVTDRVAVNVRSNDQRPLHCARGKQSRTGGTRQEHNRRRRSEADWRRDRPPLSHRRRTVRRLLRKHRHTESALKGCEGGVGF